MFKPSIDQIKKVMETKGYIIFSGVESRGLNIVGIRNQPNSPDKFDDTIVLFYLVSAAPDLMYFSITTDPSTHYLQKPVSSHGCAILKEGQYSDTYDVSMHMPPSGNNHMAVCQRLGKVSVYRDNTKDGKLNFVNPETGMFGINIHKLTNPLISRLTHNSRIFP